MWKFIYDSGMVKDNIADFDLLRDGDGTIVSNLSAAFKGGKITRAEWSKANKCRKYLRVLTISDIASCDGRSIDNNMLKGKMQLDIVQ